jgi:hypothetical protein
VISEEYGGENGGITEDNVQNGVHLCEHLLQHTATTVFKINNFHGRVRLPACRKLANVFTQTYF